MTRNIPFVHPTLRGRIRSHPHTGLAVALLALVTITGPAFADPTVQHFDPWFTTLPPITNSDASWADFDNDGDPDLVICGLSAAGRITKTYRNTGGTLAELIQFPPLIGVDNEGSGPLAWGDYDGDGDLDLAVAGTTDTGRVTRVYRNDGTGQLTEDTSQSLTGLSSASLAWGDYDRDGDLDLLAMGWDGSAYRTILYRNHPQGTLSSVSLAGMLGLAVGSADWADWDGDGDPDLVITGTDGTSPRIRFYRNEPTGTLIDDGDHGLPPVALSDVAWGDYDNDGVLDLALTGNQGTVPHVGAIYHNDGTGTLTLQTTLDNFYRSSLAWGDYDNDGDLDIAFCGYTGTSVYTRIYKNTAGSFALDPTAFQGVCEGSVAWADVDGDLDLDLLVMGNRFGTKYTQLYRDEEATPDVAPTPPDSLNAYYHPSDGTLRLFWSGATDPQTPTAGLYYSLRVGTTAGGSDVMSGTYGSPLLGNVGQATSLVLSLPPPPSAYYAAVKAIDTGLLSSIWTTTTAEADSINIAVTGITFEWGHEDKGQMYTQFRMTPNVGVQARAKAAHAISTTINYFVTNQPARYIAWAIRRDYNAMCPYDLPDCSTGFCPGYNDIWGHQYPNGTCAKKYDSICYALQCGCFYDIHPAEVWSSGWYTWDPSMQYAQVQIEVTGPGGECTTEDNWIQVAIPNPMSVDGAPPPTRAMLLAPAPSPFRETTTIGFALPRASQARLEVYDASGRLVRSLFDGNAPIGYTRNVWDGRNQDGWRVAPGVYFCRLWVEGEVHSSRTLLLR